MKLQDLYRTAVERGMTADGRSAEEIARELGETKAAYEKLEEPDKGFFDLERLENPYDDTRICNGSRDAEVRSLIVGIDMEVGEVLLADRLREKGTPIDLVLAHHPEGPGYANLHRVMYLQADLWAAQGVGIGLADSLIGPRAEEIRRRIMPVNHYRAVDAARELGLPMMSCHTPADNCVNDFVQRSIAEADPRTLDDLVRMLKTIPEYADGAKKGYGPILIQGKGSARCGKVLVDMTGGTEGPTAALDKLSAAGVDTLVGMHYSEEHRKHAEEIGLNLVIAGHISSDTIGMNLILDAIQARAAEPIEVRCISGMIRVER